MSLNHRRETSTMKVTDSRHARVQRNEEEILTKLMK